MEIKAIETRYRGYRFRSRLEARWAVFFDTLKIRWDYEPEGMKLPDGTCYLPDFKLYIGDGHILCEVKHQGVSMGDDELVKTEYAAKSGVPILLLNGTPDMSRLWTCFYAPNVYWPMAFKDSGCKLEPVSDSMFSVVMVDPNKGHFYLPSSWTERDVRKDFGKGLVDAVNAARSARFEHGESGAA